MTPSFVLFVTGHNARSLAAATNLRRVCDERFGAGAYDLEIVDVLDQPERADASRVIATPTAVRVAPLPRRRVIGDLSALDQLALALELPPSKEPPS